MRPVKPAKAPRGDLTAWLVAKIAVIQRVKRKAQQRRKWAVKHRRSKP